MPAAAASSADVVAPRSASRSYRPRRMPSSTDRSSRASSPAMKRRPENASTSAVSCSVRSIVTVICAPPCSPLEGPLWPWCLAVTEEAPERNWRCQKDSVRPPAHGMFGLVCAERPGMHGVGEVTTQRGMSVADAVDGVLDAPCDGLAGPLDRVAGSALAPAETRRPRQLGDEELPLRADLGRSAVIVVGFGLCEIVLELLQASAVGGDGPAVESDVRAGGHGRPCRDVGGHQFADVDGLSRDGQEGLEVVHALGVLDDGVAPGERHGPDITV